MSSAAPARTTTTTPDDGADRERALAFDRGLYLRGARRARRHPWGWGWRDSRFPSVWSMNALRAVGPLPPDAGPDAVEEALERHQGDAPHRRLVCEDGEDAARLMAPLRARGWQVSTEVVMVLRGPRDRAPAPGLAREVDAATLHPVEVATMLDEPELRDAPGARAVAEEVVAARRALETATPTRWFCGAWEGRDGCNTTLYSDGRAAQVENVGTVPDLRGHGLARATVSLAVDAALADGREFVLIFADDDDWPKGLYAKLGFRPVGRVRTFLRPAAPPGHAASG